MQNGQHDLGRRTALLLVNANGDTAPVVDDRDGIVHMDRHFNSVAVARESFVNRVVDDLVNQMVKTDVSCRADVHRRALAHGIATL